MTAAFLITWDEVHRIPHQEPQSYDPHHSLEHFQQLRGKTSRVCSYHESIKEKRLPILNHSLVPTGLYSTFL